MLIEMFKSKIHRATITQADLNYMGSLTLDMDLIEAAGMRLYEKVHVLNINNGQRFETYIIEGERGSGVVCLNGACARLGEPGDLIIALTYAQMSPEEADAHRPISVFVDENNTIKNIERTVKSADPFETSLA
ncbi:MAG: aspartate 1-decarboxylase [Candidatus Hydrogenedentota bacterium]|nr:MAG: aspartate 1-decarboxylase [Candidatus Hydrogenedentota bacterium]